MKNSTNEIRKQMLSLLQLVVGLALCSMAMACFALPYNMVVAGVAGIGRTFDYYFGFGVTPVVYAANIIFFIIGAIFLGKKFAASVTIGTFLYPTFLEMFSRIDAMQQLVEEPILAALCAGVLDGIGIGLVIRMGGSTGGIDIPPIILNKKFGIKIPLTLSIIDIVILVSQLGFTSTNGIILGILYTLIYSIVMDKVLLYNQGGVQIFIFSKHSIEINEMLLKMGYGTTLFEGKGGYLREKKDIVYTVVSNRILNTVKNAILALDDKAFITIAPVNEVNGNGFTRMLTDQDYVENIAERAAGR